MTPLHLKTVVRVLQLMPSHGRGGRWGQKNISLLFLGTNGSMSMNHSVNKRHYNY